MSGNLRIWRSIYAVITKAYVRSIYRSTQYERHCFFIHHALNHYQNGTTNC